MKKTAPLRTPDEQQVALGVVGGDGSAELGDAPTKRLRVDEDIPDVGVHVAHRPSRSLRTMPSQPGATATPGTATTGPSCSATTGHCSRAARGTLASTSRSCTFLRRPARRSPSRRVRTTSPGASDDSRHGPHSTVPSSRSSSYSRTARTPPPRSAWRGALARGEQLRKRALHPRGEPSDAPAPPRAGPPGPGDRAARGAGRIVERTSPRFVVGFVASSRQPSPAARQYARVSSRQTVEERTHDAVARRGLIPRVEPLATRRSSTVSTWSLAVCPVARFPKCARRGVSRVAQSCLRGLRRDVHDLRAQHRGAVLGVGVGVRARGRRDGRAPRDRVAEAAQGVPEARRVRSTGDEAGHRLARREQLVAGDLGRRPARGRRASTHCGRREVGSAGRFCSADGSATSDASGRSTRQARRSRRARVRRRSRASGRPARGRPRSRTSGAGPRRRPIRRSAHRRRRPAPSPP